LRPEVVAGNLAAPVFLHELHYLTHNFNWVKWCFSFEQCVKNYGAVFLEVTNSRRETVVAPAAGIATHDILNAVNRRTPKTRTIDQRLEQFTGDEGREIVPPLAKIFSIIFLTVFGKRSFDRGGIEARIEL
jgi:hypothetical protein